MSATSRRRQPRRPSSRRRSSLLLLRALSSSSLLLLLLLCSLLLAPTPALAQSRSTAAAPSAGTRPATTALPPASASTSPSSSNSAANPAASGSSSSSSNATQQQQQQQRSACMRYSQELFPTEQQKQFQLIKLLINSLFAGNYSNVARFSSGSDAYTGILVENGKYTDPDSGAVKTVNLLQYFNGSLLSTNRNGMPTSVNFLDGGGVKALRDGIAAYGGGTSVTNQLKLMQHFYSYFAYLLGCDEVGNGGSLRGYDGSQSMGTTHKYMNINKDEFYFFLQQFTYTCNTLGFAAADTTELQKILTNFYYRCSQPQAFPDTSLPPTAQSICTDPSCQIAQPDSKPDCSIPDSNGTGGIAPQRVVVPGSGSSAGAIAGGVIGGLLGLALVLGLVWFCLRRKKKQQDDMYRRQRRAHEQEMQERHRAANNGHQLNVPGQAGGSGSGGRAAGPSILKTSNNNNSSPGSALATPASRTGAGAGAAGAGYFDAGAGSAPRRHGSSSRSRGGGGGGQASSAEPAYADARPSVSSPGGASFSSDQPYAVAGQHQAYQPPNSASASSSAYHNTDASSPSVYMSPSDNAYDALQHQQQQQRSAAPRTGTGAGADMPSVAPPTYELYEMAPVPVPDHMQHIPRDVELPPEEAQRLMQEAAQARMAALAQHQQQQQPAGQAPVAQQTQAQAQADPQTQLSQQAAAQQQQQQQQSSSSSSAAAAFTPPSDRKDPAGPSNDRWL